MKRCIVVPLLLLALQDAPAYADQFNMVAAGCVPYSDWGLYAQSYLVTGGTIKFQSNKTGTIQLLCGLNVPAKVTSPVTMEILSSGDVDAHYIAMNRGTLLYEDVAMISNSDASPLAVTSVALPGNFVTNMYFVEVTISRSTTAVNPTFYRVTLR